MFRPMIPPSRSYSLRWQEYCGRLLAPLTLWICVSVSLRYGYFNDRHMVIGPSSSRLMKVSSVFVEQVEVRDDDKKGVILYGFSEKPALSFEKNWSLSDDIIVAPYSKKGFPLWLNKDSRIRLSWKTQTSILNQLQVVLIKGESKYETMLPTLTTAPDALNLSAPFNDKEAEYMIQKDDKYCLGLVNTNSKSILVKIAVNVTSRLHDLSKAMNMCSTIGGSCRLMLFPETRYVLATTPANKDVRGWHVELYLVARVVTYIAILGFITVIIFLILKYLGSYDSDQSSIAETTATPSEVPERQPILPDKPIRLTYGTNEEDDDEDETSSSSSEDLYDSKLCVICYDEQRNCFFVPCGHCATCYDCAQRIMEGESRMCPICRRLIHKARRLFTP